MLRESFGHGPIKTGPFGEFIGEEYPAAQGINGAKLQKMFLARLPAAWFRSPTFPS